MKYEEKDIIDLLKKENVVCVKMLFDDYYRALCVYALRFLNSFLEIIPANIKKTVLQKKLNFSMK